MSRFSKGAIEAAFDTWAKNGGPKRLGIAAGIGLAAAGYARHQFHQGFNPNNELSKQFYELTTGNPNLTTDTLGQDRSLTSLYMLPKFLSTDPNMLAGTAGAAAGAVIPLTGGAAIMAKSKSMKMKALGAGIMAGSVVSGWAGHQAGKYAPSLSTGVVNSTTVGDYNRTRRMKMPYVPGDMVLGMYNTRLG